WLPRRDDVPAEQVWASPSPTEERPPRAAISPWEKAPAADDAVLLGEGSLNKWRPVTVGLVLMQVGGGMLLGAAGLSLALVLLSAPPTPFVIWLTGLGVLGTAGLSLVGWLLLLVGQVCCCAVPRWTRLQGLIGAALMCSLGATALALFAAALSALPE